MHKIAIVEDAKDNRDFLYYLLRDEYQVLRYGTGEEALRDFARQVPDLIVLDIWLPDMDGVEVLKRLRQEDALQNVTVIALTANAMVGDREKYLAAGFNEYVSKPIMDIDAFLSIIRGLLAASEPHN
jgi:two-component system cell cycle response regulator DivK